MSRDLPKESVTPPAALQHEELAIPPSLAPFVTRRMRTWTEESIDLRLPLPPTGSLFLTLVYGDAMTLEFEPGAPQPAPELFIGGQLRRIMPVSRIQGRVGLTGFEFTPTGFHRLFHQDCQRFTDQATSLETVMPESARALRRATRSAASVKEKMEHLQAFLLERVPGAREATVVDEAVIQVEREHGCVTVKSLAEHCHLSERQLNRRFLREVGVGPKHFAKVVQIRQALMTLQAGTTGELKALAQRVGYFDQAHFINDFQRLIGTTPIAFLESGNAFLRTYMKHYPG